MLDRVRPWGRRMALIPASALARLGVSPNVLTVIGLLLNVFVAWVIASGQPVLGGVLVLLANAFDMLDGGVARLTGKVTRFGAFFDSTIDRYSEAVMYLGVGAWLYSRGEGMLLLAAYASIIGSLMVSYARARAEGIGVGGEVGLLPRPERIILLALALIFHEYLLAPVLWVLAVLSNVTAVQRMVHVHRELASQKPD